MLSVPTLPVTDAIAGITIDAQDLSGVVVDALGAPVRDAEITLESGGSVAPRSTRADASGTFSFASVAPGKATLVAKRLGFRPYTIAFLADTMSRARPIRITMQPAPQQLDTVNVAVAENSAIRAFNERRKRHSSGHFIVRSDLEKRMFAYTSEALRAVPSLILRPNPRGGNIVRIRGCRPALYLDGVQIMNAELDEVTRPADIEGIEVYSSAAGGPVQYADRFGRSCGIVLVWTRSR
ncbi:MAG TPA: carboxypeptidase regulatory-like domain-containing protein [Gemmatimonadaceae bacterium]|nr:carboxypeptidase regulatory-like domain-containing protein [Gemmatimonadaceae bacterium]